MPHSLFKLSTTFALVSSLFACSVADPSQDDGEGTTEEAVTLDLEEGSPNALGVLELVNTATYEMLDGTAEVGLTSIAAGNIVAHRETDPFDTIAELDAIPSIGPAALRKLLAYAQAHGYIPQPTSNDPFDPASCTGPAMTRDQMIARLGPGGTRAALADYKVILRTRTCNSVSGCTPEWTYDETPVYRSDSSAGSALEGTAELRAQSGMVQLYLHEDTCTGTSGHVSEYGSHCSLSDTGARCGSYSYYSSRQWGGSGGYFCHGSGFSVGWEDPRPVLTGTLTDDCVRLSMFAGRPGTASSWTEYEAALLARF